MSKQVRADGILILVTLCWGVSYLLMDISLEELDPFTLNAFRFLGAFAIAALVSFKKIRTVNKTTLKYSLLVGFRTGIRLHRGYLRSKIYFSVQLGISLRADSGIHSHIGMAVF